MTMRWFLILSLMLGVPAAAAAGPIRYTRYRDAFLSAEVPAEAKPIGDGSFRLLHDDVWTEFSLTGSLPHVDDRAVDCDGHPATYRVSKANLFAYSCLVNGKIKYYIGKQGRTYRVGASDSTELVEFTIAYSASQRGFWDPVVAHMSAALGFSR